MDHRGAGPPGAGIARTHLTGRTAPHAGDARRQNSAVTSTNTGVGPADPAIGHATAVARLRAFPTAVVTFLVLLAAAGITWFLMRRDAIAVATCGGDPMAPGETCAMRSRRNGRYEHDYDQRLTAAENSLTGQRIGALLLVIVALVLLVLVLVRWLADRGAAARMSRPVGLLSATAMPTGIVTVLLGLLAAGAAALGPVLALALNGPNRTGFSTLAIVLLALVVAFVAAMLWFARPRGTTLVQVFDQGIVVITGSRPHRIGWQELRYFAPGAAEATTGEVGWAGRRRRLSIDEESLFRVLRERIDQAQWPLVQQRLVTGEPIDFVELRIERGALVRDTTVIPLAQLTAAGVEYKDKALHYTFQGQGAQISVSAVRLANSGLLFRLLREHTGATGL